MKKSIILVIASIAFLNSCNKEPDYVSKVVDVTYPTITLNGPAFVYVPLGGTYTDQGATLVDDVTHVSSQITPTSSEVNTSSPGLYAVTYEAANANGFKTTAVRGVLVLSYTPPSGLDSTFDLTGQYARSNGIITNVMRMANGLYIIDNAGGSTLVRPAYFTTPDTTSMDVPPQITFGGDSLDATGETLVTTPPPIHFSYALASAGFGTQVRTFYKQ